MKTCIYNVVAFLAYVLFAGLSAAHGRRHEPTSLGSEMVGSLVCLTMPIVFIAINRNLLKGKHAFLRIVVIGLVALFLSALVLLIAVGMSGDL